MPAGTVVSSGSLVSPGGQQGIPGPNAVSTDAGNQATFGSDSRIYVPNPTPVITSVRLRSFNAVGNANFEVDQRTVGTGFTAASGSAAYSFAIDRWMAWKANASAIGFGVSQGNLSGNVIPGVNFAITSKLLGITLNTQQTTLAATDTAALIQYVEGPVFRELSGNPHSISILVNATVPLKFSIALQDPAAAWSLVKLCTISTANTWTLITLPNLPTWAAGGNFTTAPGLNGYVLFICFAAGSSKITPAADTWQSGNFIGAPGMDNFGAQPVNSSLYIAFVQHEPEALCTTLIDKPFMQNYDECLRCYSKAQTYNVLASNASGGQWCSGGASGNSVQGNFVFPKPMAKIPTVSVWNPSTGAANSITNVSAGAQQPISAVTQITSVGFGGFSISGSLPVSPTIQYCLANWAADTGW